MKNRKIILIVWSPFLILGLVYGCLYFLHYEHANHLKKKAQTSFQDCEDTASAPAPPGEVPFIPSCEYPGTIDHGFLGWPSYQPSNQLTN